MSHEKLKNFEREEGQELTFEERGNLAEAWLSIAVDGQNPPENIESLNNEQLKIWFYETLMDDTEKLVAEWGLQPDAALIEKIKSEQKPEQRAGLEMEYISDIRAKIQEFKKAHPLGERSDKWDSWPSEMRKNKIFNCVGATLLGISFLDKAAIHSYYGNPFSHVLNIIKLSDGQWVYADFLNDQVKKIKAEEIILGNTPSLKIKEPDIIYRYIPLLDNREAPVSILGNLHSLEKDIKDKKADPADKREAQRIFSNFKEKFKKNDFSKLHDILYPSRVILHRAKETQEEGGRIEKIRSISSLARKYIATLEPAQRGEIVEETRRNKEGIRKLFYENDNEVLGKVTPELRRTFELLRKRAKNIKTKNPELYRDFVELLINR